VALIALYMLVALLLGIPTIRIVGSARGAELTPPSRCIDVAIPKGAVAARDGKWIELTNDQWQFLRGIYAMNPLTPPVDCLKVAKGHR
jgi:hypothetical protein